MSMDKIFGILEEIASDTFMYDVQLDASTTAQDIDGWDSLSHTVFMMKIEQRFGINFPIEQTLSLKNVGELAVFLLRLLEQKGQLP